MTDRSDQYPFAAGFEKADEAQWRTLAEKALRGAKFETLTSRTADGIEIQPLTHIPAGGLATTRPLRAHSGRWSILTRIDHANVEAANQQARLDIDGGANGLQLVFAKSAGACGFGLDANSGQTIREVLEGIDPAETGLVLDLPPTVTAPASGLAGLIAASGLNPASARVNFGLDPLGHLWWADSNKDNLAEALKDSVGQALTLSGQGFSGPFLSADARPVHAAGGSEVQELAFLLSAATTYLRAVETAGLSLAQAQGFTGFRMAADADQFASIAKFRALRRLIARLHEVCGLKPEPIAVHAETAWRMMTGIDPWVNVLRSTVATFSAVTGGADQVSVLPHSQAIGLPDTEARRLARNLQLVLQEEAHLAVADDPAGGAGGIESLTDGLCEQAWVLFQHMEAEGGLINSVTSGSFGSAVTTARDTHMTHIADAAQPLTGASSFPNIAETPAEPAEPVASNWVDVYASTWRPMRLSEPFEALRKRAWALARTGKTPGVFLANLGTLADHNARTNFAMNFFAAGGIQSISSDSGQTVENLAAAFRDAAQPIACICSSDTIYTDDAASLIAALKQNGAHWILLAGRGGGNDEVWRGAGLDGYIHQGCPMVEILDQALNVFETLD